MKKSVQTLGAILFLSLATSCTSMEKTSDTSKNGASVILPILSQDLTPLSADKVRPLMIGAKVPDVTLVTPDGKPFNLAREAQAKPTILIFYRGGWCPYCNTQLQDLRKVEKPLIKLGFQLVAVSPDKPSELQDSVVKNKLGYKLVSDSNAELIRAMGIAFKVDDETIGKYKGFGIDLERASDQTHHLLPVPSVFVLDRLGKIVFEYVNPDYKVRLPAAVILAAAQANYKALQPAAR